MNINKMVNSKKKGNRFEREVAKFLTELTKVKWERVPCSGGFATSRKVQNNVFKGDVFTEDEMYKNYVIECKFPKTLELNECFSNKSKLYKYIEQCQIESDNNEWLLFIKVNNKGWYMLIDSFNVLSTKIIETYNLKRIVLDVGYSLYKLK